MILKKMLFSDQGEIDSSQNQNQNQNQSQNEMEMEMEKEEDLEMEIEKEEDNANANASQPNNQSAKGYFMFLGDTNVPSFFRRPSSSNDGIFAIIPCGMYQDRESNTCRNCSYLYINGIFDK